MAVSGRYGYHRDELYFLECGRHLAWGYVDQPPLTPLVARISSDLLANSLVGLRVIPALGLAALVVMTANMARLLGAGRSGRLIAALASATCGEFLGTMHLLSTTTLDFVFWALTITLVLVLLERQDPRYWLAIGGCVGLAFEAKWNIGFLVAALGVGFLATPARRLLRSRYLVIGAIIAGCLAAPDLAWQATHGWPELAVFRVLQTSAGHNRAVYWPAQILYSGLALTPVWVAGLMWSFRDPAARRYRPVAIAAGLVLVLQFALGGKPYYSGAVFTYLFAAGAIEAERFMHGTRRSWRDRKSGERRSARRVTATILWSCALSLPVALPVLPARALHAVPLQKINYDLGEMIAWPKLVALVAHEYDSIPTAERARTAVLTGNYGEAGAIDRYGSGFGLPQAYSGQNNFWLWGPPPAPDRLAVVVDIGPGLLEEVFTHVRRVATFENGLGVSDDEEGAPIYLVSGLRTSWAAAWPKFRHYD
jgi:4-amino-4-deoxy-L-arabinose transferase-like glycosyltransferase